MRAQDTANMYSLSRRAVSDATGGRPPVCDWRLTPWEPMGTADESPLLGRQFHGMASLSTHSWPAHRHGQPHGTCGGKYSTCAAASGRRSRTGILALAARERRIHEHAYVRSPASAQAKAEGQRPSDHPKAKALRAATRSGLGCLAAAQQSARSTHGSRCAKLVRHWDSRCWEPSSLSAPSLQCIVVPSSHVCNA
jgi:hypothetical protein